MTTKGKVILIGSAGLATAAAAYYFLVYSKNKSNSNAAFQTIQEGITNAQASAGRSMTLESLKAMEWKNSALVGGLGRNITSYNPSTGLIGHADSNWSGIMLDPNTIQWTHKNGQTDIWKSPSGVSGFKRLSGVVNSKLMA